MGDRVDARRVEAAGQALNRERSVVAEVLRDWLHETPMSQCDRGSDTCGTWPLAYEVADKIVAALACSDGAVGGVVAREEYERVERERDLAIAHDRQPYPTPHAYEKACEALQQTRETADALAEAVHACRWNVANPYETDTPVLVAGEDWQAVQRALAAYRRATEADPYRPDGWDKPRPPAAGLRVEPGRNKGSSDPTQP